MAFAWVSDGELSVLPGMGGRRALGIILGEEFALGKRGDLPNFIFCV